MSLLSELEKIWEDVRGKLAGKVSTDVMDDVHAIVDQGKAQASQLLDEAGHDAQADAGAVASDASQVAGDAAAAAQPTPPAAG